MANQWFKFYGGEYLCDPKILQLNSQERSCWITLMCLASQTKDGTIKFLSEKQLLLMSGVTEDISVIKKFEEMDMIEVCNGNVTLRNWLKRQLSESIIRVRDHRMKQKCNGNVTTEENRIEENRIEENRKNIYGEFEKVLLTSEEYQKLIDRFGEQNTSLLISELDTGIASKGYKYKNHYATILNWARRKLTERVEKINNPKNKIHGL